MITKEDFHGIQVVTPSPSGEGGKLVQDSLKELAQRVGPVRISTSQPTSSDDESQGYFVGSRWYDIDSDEEYVCLDASEGNAVWKATTASEADLSNYYTKAEVDSIVGDIESGDVDLTNYYNKTEVDSLLDGKSNTGHTHSISDVTDLSSELNEFSLHMDNSSVHFTQAQISITESQISNLDKYTQSQVDNLLSDKADSSDLQTHIDNASIHRQINDSGTGSSDLWSAAKIAQEISNSGGGVSEIGDLNDISINNIQDGHFLQYVGGVWQNVSNIDLGELIFEARTAPPNPPADSVTVYVTAMGDSPNRQVVYKVKDETGEEVILSSKIV